MRVLVPVLMAAGLLAACGGSSGDAGSETGSADPPVVTEPDWARVRLLGGDTTNLTGSQSSFGFDTPAPNLDADALALHRQGDTEFERSFIRGPAPGFAASDGLGPVFNNPSCNGCHNRDGRANYSLEVLQAPAGSWTRLGADAGIFLRLSLADPDCSPAAANRYCEPKPVPGFGTQLFHRGVLGLRDDSPFSGMADVYVRFEPSQVAYEDGTTVGLVRPRFQIRNPYDSSGEVAGDRPQPASRLLQADVRTSPRNGLPMFGLGLLEAVPEADILALADPADADGDGILGRPNWVYDAVKARSGDPAPVSLGRFGWKANTPSVVVQGSGAYRGDIGITNTLFPDESIADTPIYAAYRGAHPDDDGEAASGYEASDEVVRAVMFYSSTLAVPARRNVDDPTVVKGAVLFERARCAVCHRPTLKTGKHPGLWTPGGLVPVPALDNQTIHPFTDMLLHDMGEDLADERTDFRANGREWKTRPLWGIGLTMTVNPLAGFLHDGRARTLEEAILWHGGEALASRDTFRKMNATDRAALLAFLNSL